MLLRQRAQVQEMLSSLVLCTCLGYAPLPYYADHAFCAARYR